LRLTIILVLSGLAVHPLRPAACPRPMPMFPLRGLSVATNPSVLHKSPHVLRPHPLLSSIARIPDPFFTATCLGRWSRYLSSSSETVPLELRFCFYSGRRFHSPPSGLSLFPLLDAPLPDRVAKRVFGFPALEVRKNRAGLEGTIFWHRSR